MAEIDFSRYYDLESYLFDEVSKRFRETRSLSAFGFFCIIIWKANRAKSRVARRLLAQGYKSLEDAVRAIFQQMGSAQTPKDRLSLLIRDWGFRLPMASAILTVLYPDDFTVYDIRVCDLLGDFQDAQNRTQFDVLWTRYSQYIERVRAEVPSKSTLREKDRYLWGRSFADQLHRDVSRGFGDGA